MEDPELIAQVRSGNVELFGKLIERYQRQLYYFVIGKFREHTEAQDIVQKSFVTAYQNLATLADDDSFFPWLKGIALNHCRNEWRRYHSQATMKERLLEAKRAELGILWLEKERGEGSSRIDALRDCMQRLKPEEQTLVEYRFVQELSMEEIGVELNKGAEAARLWLYRVRLRLAECVRRKLSLPEGGETA
jgi:RNA polymerase sigma-70 factor (ECF subfamily)